jgi:hypothetical protein
MGYRIGDCFQYSSDICDYYVISKTYDFKTLTKQKRFALKIASRLSIVAMSIQLYGQLGFQAGEVRNVAPDNMLAAETSIG